MTTETPTPVFAPRSALDLGTHETAPLQPCDERIIDALALLDHRTKRRAIPQRLARRGPHLALGDGAETLLLPLESKITHVGRGVASEVRFEDQRVSRSHAIIVRHGRYARVLDNRSANGTFVNGRQIVATNLRSGDVIGIGPVAMQYVEID
jgi:hypothetical protein